jgi:hypothetical protein
MDGSAGSGISQDAKKEFLPSARRQEAIRIRSTSNRSDDFNILYYTFV